MTVLNTMRTTPLARKVVIGALVALVLFTLIGFFVVPPVLKAILIKKLSENLHREVTIQEITSNPFILSVKVRGLSIKEREGPKRFLSFDELYVNLQGISLFKRGLIVSELRIDKPYVNIVRKEDNSYNFSDLIPAKGSKPEPESKPLRFSLNNVQILNGSVDFWDGPKKTQHTVKDMNIAIPFLSNLPYYIETYTQPKFEAKINNTPLLLRGMTKPFADSLETSFDVDIKNFDMP